MAKRQSLFNGVLALSLLGATACSGIQQSVGLAEPEPERDPAVVAAERRQAQVRAQVEAIPMRPQELKPKSAPSLKVWQQGVKDRKLRVLVSREDRALWLVRDTTVLYRAPIAVGTSEKFAYSGKTYDFTTPVGVRKVRGRAESPLWVPPEWHFYEIAVDQNLKPVHLKPKSKIKLSDGTSIEVRGKQVGRVNEFGNFWPFTPGAEIVFDGKVFIPPYGTDQRSVPEILGTHKLELGDGYLIHGTNEEDSIGAAVSHGCVRMYNEHVAELFELVPDGTAVYIY